MLRSVRWLAVVLAVVPAVCAAQSDVRPQAYDLLLVGGRIVDGTGSPWYYGDVAVHQGRIVAVGRLHNAAARRTIDCRGLVVAPGFIDMMGQTATPLVDDPGAAFNLLTQGITTINCGEGASAAPLPPDDASAPYRTMAEYFAWLNQSGLPLHAVQTVGHTQVRRVVLGDVDRRPTPEELQQMQALVDEAMQAGAIGVSTALIYPPAVYATTDEIAALATTAARHGGGYYTHMRNEGDRLLPAIDEALAIGRASGARVHIFHLKAAGEQNWATMDQAVARIKAARAGGQQVAADVYPYVNNGLGIVAFLHPRHAAEGRAALEARIGDPKWQAEMRAEMETGTDFENWYRHVRGDWNRVMLGALTEEKYRPHNGKSLAAVAQALGTDPWDVFFSACQQGAFAMPQTMSEANLTRQMREEFVSFCTDVGPADAASRTAHPRAFGSFPRILHRYVRELGVLSLEAAIHRMTAAAANELTLFDRGRIAPGLAADLVVFDPDTISDAATFAQPRAPSRGIKLVLVAGVAALVDGQYTGTRSGRMLTPGVP